ncbi:MAG: DUF3098 domain-containing protein [Saprospiraceae bacterium]
MSKEKVSNSPRSESLSSIGKEVKDGLLYGRKNYILILVALGLIFLGLLLMSGGRMPSDDIWDESIIYSFRRITLAPIVIISGLVVGIFAIFAKK